MAGRNNAPPFPLFNQMPPFGLGMPPMFTREFYLILLVLNDFLF